MQTRDMLGFMLVPLGLLGVAWFVSQVPIWNDVASWTIPWFCSALAIALLILGGTCLATGRSPTAVPLKVSVVVYAVTVGVLGVGLAVDAVRVIGLEAMDLQTALSILAERSGFSLILLVVFASPWLAARQPTA